MPSSVVYSLTEYGESVLPLVELVRSWCKSHMQRQHAADAPATCARAGASW